MASWKLTSSESEEIEYTSFLSCRKYFAVDDSTSTKGSALRQERAFVEALRENYPNTADAISLWGKTCDDPTTQFESVQWCSRHRGTFPSDILKNSAALSAIQKSDAWFLLTDGEIYTGDVHRLADLAYNAEVLNVPLVFLITGSRGSSPGTANISVGISFFANSHDTLILFKDKHTGRIYVIAGKGCFAQLGGSAVVHNLDEWNNLTTFATEDEFFRHCRKCDIKVAKAEGRAKGVGGISLGSVWEEQNAGVRVDIDLLLGSGILADADAIALLAEGAFNTIAVACKTSRRMPELRAFVRAQKVEQIAPKFEDRNGAATIVAAMTNGMTGDEDRRRLQEQLREAHVKNRQDYSKMVADFAGSVSQQTLRTRNQLVDSALQSLASIDASSYNADILSRRSNRARRAEVIQASSKIDVAQLDLEAPSYKGYCLICCGEDEIMSICFKETAPDNREDNTSDFALNFPLAAGASEKNVDLISSQNVCFQCALLGHDGMSIYKEKLTAVVPVVQFEGNNKKYITDQLYAALTARLTTGAAGVAQLCMSMLQNVMRTRSWAGANMDPSTSVDGQDEAAQRRKTFQWMLDQLVQNTHTRESFNETGSWVSFPQALTWVANDFESNGLASFAITYPVAGFNSLLALGQQTNTFSTETIFRTQSSKALYSITAKYLADLQIVPQRGRGGLSNDRTTWKQIYLELIYRDFNGLLTPTDNGEASILSDIETFNQRLSHCLAETTRLIDHTTMRKIQILLFWLLYTQQNHCTVQTFFTRITHDFPIGATVLSPTLPIPTSEHHDLLLSIFATHGAGLIDSHQSAAHNTVIPFANPFGASVLRCGVQSCAHPFTATETLDPHCLTPHIASDIRRARADHLIAVFGIKGRFETSDTGLPGRVVMGQPPSSVHVNMHICIAREWAARTPYERREIVKNGAARKEFVGSVRRRLCVDGRGDVYYPCMERDVKAMLPSFFEVLVRGLRMEGRSGEDIAVYEHDFAQNKVQHKVAWELMVERSCG